jgi:hypothetical protein
MAMNVSNNRPASSNYQGSSASASSPTGDKKSFIDKNQPETKGSKQWGDDIFMDSRKGDKAQRSADSKDGRQVSQANTAPSYVEGNEGSRYVGWEQDVAEFKTGTGFSKDGTGAQFEASALEAQGDASYIATPLQVGGRAGAEANLASLRGDAGFGKDLSDIKGLDKIDGKAYAGVHGEVLVGANADAKAKASVDFKNGDVGLEAGAGALVGAEASATGRGELGPVQSQVTGSAIAGIGAAANGKIALEDGKLTLGVKAKAALGLGLGFETSTTIDFNKVKNTVDNFTGGKLTQGAKDVTHKVADGTKDVTHKVADGAKDLGNDIKKGFSKIFG